MVKMPVQVKGVPKEEETSTLQERTALAKLHLKRFCFLGSFEPRHMQRKNDDSWWLKNYIKLHQYCQLVEPVPMFCLLRTAYESVLPRGDEVALVHALYLLGHAPMLWKTDLRSHFPMLVKTDEDLFMFCKYAALLHHATHKHLFCKTIKKAITSWYKNKTSEEMAYMFAANRGRHGFTHRMLIKLCRITDRILGSKYLYQSFNSSCTELLKSADSPLPPLPERKIKTAIRPSSKNIAKKDKIITKPTVANKIAAAVNKKACNAESNVEVMTTAMAKTEIASNENTVKTLTSSSNNAVEAEVDQEKIRSIVVGVSTLRTTTDAEEAVKLIDELDLKYDQLPYHLFQYPQVLKTVAKSISCSQLIKCLHSEKIRKHFAKQDVLKVCRDRFQKKGGMKDEHIDPIMFLMSMDRLSIVQPLKPTNNKNTSRGRLVQFSKQLYRISFREMKPTNLRIHITINMQSNYMKKILKNTKSVSYQFAAVALAFSFYKVEENCEVHRWTEAIHQLVPVNWDKNMDFVGAFTACSEVKNMRNNQRLYVPILQANEKKRVQDLFIVIVPSAARGNKNNSSAMLADLLDKYRKRHNSKAKFVIVDLLRYKKSMKYSATSCENILEICGLDEHTIPLIYNFALNNFD